MANGTLPAGAVAPTQSGQTGSKAAVNLIESLLNQPSLPVGTTITPTPQQVQTGELMATPGVTGAVTAATPTVPTVPVATATAPTPTTAVSVPTTPTAPAYTGAQVGGAVPTMTAAQGTVTAPAVAQTGAVTSEATVKGQLEALQQEVTTATQQGTALPVWARGAAEATRAAMQARGMGASSMMAEALSEGIMNSAIPIAKADADTYKQMIFQNLNNRQQATIENARNYLQMDMANLSNNQQSSVENLHTRHAFLLSDQAATNASLQFNAQNQGQTDQFFSNIAKEINLTNANRLDAMKQFTASEDNKLTALNAGNAVEVDKANAERQATLNQYNATMGDLRDRFNAENQRIIDQSNVVWRREINTANTATTNASNQINAQNRLNLSNYSLSNLWQQWRDEASWVNTSSQNALTRAHNVALSALERTTALDLQDETKRFKMYELLGDLALGIFGTST